MPFYIGRILLSTRNATKDILAHCEPPNAGQYSDVGSKCDDEVFSAVSIFRTASVRSDVTALPNLVIERCLFAAEWVGVSNRTATSFPNHTADLFVCSFGHCVALELTALTGVASC